ncbi:MAG: bifunctional phosphopantothenoylcysteine decarboxylase/phosphopantothenate--cysteine ligase CoaBC [Deltaproteobacteria bacterium]|nr:bifunctional phosphopantothenoylcysteine decarboxylase/phosphopantothenate--cysteine ligase CoaBC [Deltaproteobacteria bacterium]
MATEQDDGQDTGQAPAAPLAGGDRPTLELTYGAARHTVVLGVSGSIAAFKAVELARLLLKAGVHVLPVMTASAQRFLGPATLGALCGEPVHSDMFAAERGGESHVELARKADVVVLAPATADLIASLAQGRADDLLRALVLCARCPIVVAPAMHPRMWEHPATQRNVALLRQDGRAVLVGPVEGEVASGERGVGRMAEPELIAERVLGLCRAQDLKGLHVAVTAGPTVEDIDPVRVLSNRSSGKMGFAVAERAAARGARVTLLAGPVELPTPPGVARIDVRTTASLSEALASALGPDQQGVDALVMAAAVADYRPAAASGTKIRRSGEPLRLELVPNPDLLAAIGAARRGAKPYLVGFALEAGTDAALLAAARAKLEAKRVDLVVANRASEALGGDETRAALVSRERTTPLDRTTKRALADLILDRVVEACRR